MKKTSVYTYNDGLSGEEVFRDVHGHPDIMLFDYSGLNKPAMLELFKLESAEIKTSGVFNITTDGVADTPDYFIHEINIKNNGNNQH